jgi:uncharacterized phage protein gp47/JayE
VSGTTSPTACYIDETGIHSPAFTDILTVLQGAVQGIFGSDTYLGSDSQDGQLLGVFAQAIYDTNSMAIAVYNSYSPATAVGVGLSSVVKINGLSRELPTNSTATVQVVGGAGTIISGGIVRDANFNQWNLPSSVTIAPTGQATVTATAAVAGAISAPAGPVTIATPILGWQSASFTVPAVPGAPLESDPTLRARQNVSTMLPSVTAIDGMTGAVFAVNGVTRLRVFENDTSVTDSNGIPSHSVSFVVEGGDTQEIADAIAAHKTPGAGTFGNTSEIVVDPYGVPHAYNFFVVSEVQITVVIHLTALQGYTSAVGNEIVNAVINYIDAIPIGTNVYLTHVIWAALSIAGTDNTTFNLTSLLMSRGAGAPTSADVPIAFNEAAQASPATVSLSIP